MCGLCVVPAGAGDAAPGKSNGGDDEEGAGSMGLIIVVVAVAVLCAGLSIGAVLYCRDTEAEQAWAFDLALQHLAPQPVMCIHTCVCIPY